LIGRREERKEKKKGTKEEKVGTYQRMPAKACICTRKIIILSPMSNKFQTNLDLILVTPDEIFII
jgi:hypothetical protein